MKKIGLCVCYDTKNYGSQLQVLATQIKVGEFGYDYEIIRYKKKKTVAFMLKSLPRLLNPIFVKGKMRGISKKWNLEKYPEIKKKNEIRDKRFAKFIDDYFKKLSPVYLSYNRLKNCVDNYDAFLVGSDQLWLPSGLASGFYTLMFVPEKIKKITYATSFGVGQIPKYQCNRTREYLNRIQHISVREIKGQQIVKKLTGKEIEVVLDPTLLLSTDEWKQIIPVCKVVKAPYIFCYFLGTNPEHRKIAEELKEKTGLQIVCLTHLDEFVEGDLDFGDNQLFDVGADNFVNLIRGAKYICTDSFHGSVFSILNHKKFIIFNRFMEGSSGSRNSRIDSLCNQLGLSERRYKSDVLSEMTADIDYDVVDNRLNELRGRSLRYMELALNDV